MREDVSTSLDMTNRYAEMREKAARLREQALFPSQRIPSELELQARWFAGDFGKQFLTTNGDKIDIVQFGIWNREAGPDFSDAAIRLNGSEPIRGNIEFDLSDRNWEAHGHAINPAFENTMLHVSSTPATGRFSHAPGRTAKCPKCVSIRTPCPKPSAPTFRWR